MSLVAPTSANQKLSLILSHHLSTDQQTSSRLPAALELLTLERLVTRADYEGDEGAGVLKRWSARISLLLAPSHELSAREAGYRLVLETARQSATGTAGLLLTNGKEWVLSCLGAILGGSKSGVSSSPSLFTSVLETLLGILRLSTPFPQFHRDILALSSVSGGSGGGGTSQTGSLIRKVGEALLETARSSPSSSSSVDDPSSSNNHQSRTIALTYLKELVINYPASLRPLANDIQDVSISILFGDVGGKSGEGGEGEGLTRASADLLAGVYVLAGKAAAGNSWRRTVEGLVGCAGALVGFVSTTFIEFISQNIVLQPLSLPSLFPEGGAKPPSDELSLRVVNRLEKVVEVIMIMLRTPTERPVPIPVTAISELCLRLFSLNIEGPIKEHHDPTTRTVEVSNLVRLHVVGCRLFGQLALCVGTHLMPNLTEVSSSLAFTLSTYAPQSPVRPCFYTTYCLMLESCPFDVDEGKRSLARLARIVLEDVAVLALPSTGLVSKAGGESGLNQSNGITSDPGRKAKRIKAYETDQVFSNHVRLDLVNLAVAEMALDSLYRILQSASSFLPPNILNLSLRTLLSLSLSPAFFTTATTASTAFDSENPTELAFALRPSLRVRVLRALVCAVRTGGREVGKLVDHAVNVFGRGVGSLDEEIRRLSSDGLAIVSNLVHPIVPPFLPTQVHRQIIRDSVGGSLEVFADEVVPDFARTVGPHVGGTAVETVRAAPIDRFTSTKEITTVEGGPSQMVSQTLQREDRLEEAVPMLAATGSRLTSAQQDTDMAAVGQVVVDAEGSIPVSAATAGESATTGPSIFAFTSSTTGVDHHNQIRPPAAQVIGSAGTQSTEEILASMPPRYEPDSDDSDGDMPDIVVDTDEEE